MIIQFRWTFADDEQFITRLVFDITDAKNDYNSYLIKRHCSVWQFVSWHIGAWLAQVENGNGFLRMRECGCFKFISGHQMATSPFKGRSVTEPYSQTHEACLLICVGKWISRLDSKASDGNGLRAVICWQGILQPTVREEGSERRVCMCVCVWGIGQGALSLSVYSQ